MADRVGLLSQCVYKYTEGSNPSLPGGPANSGARTRDLQCHKLMFVPTKLYSPLSRG